MYLLSVEEQCLENHPTRLVLLSLQWNLNLSHWIKLVKKKNGSGISWKIFRIGPSQWHQELISSGIITIDYVKSKDNVSDPLTKGLSREGVERISKGMGLRASTSQHDELINVPIEVDDPLEDYFSVEDIEFSSTDIDVQSSMVQSTSQNTVASDDQVEVPCTFIPLSSSPAICSPRRTSWMSGQHVWLKDYAISKDGKNCRYSL
ncbi:hypothetical protein T459_17459 [Capsicum annuum]|uniref:Uncharacterized protein n=1 Tax=Capsicum annuum TaxID=4072 RepID=A0A2G2ZBM2_CAPAN|nr:hypothetical protein T459_17459 [Capsicum annuum]